MVSPLPSVITNFSQFLTMPLEKMFSTLCSINIWPDVLFSWPPAFLLWSATVFVQLMEAAICVYSSWTAFHFDPQLQTIRTATNTFLLQSAPNWCCSIEFFFLILLRDKSPAKFLFLAGRKLLFIPSRSCSFQICLTFSAWVSLHRFVC